MHQNKKIRIAMLGHKRVPSREGGIEIVVEELATRMAKKGFSVTCYNRRGHHVSGKEYDNNTKILDSVTVKSVFTIDKCGLAAVSSSFFASIKAAFSKYDIVHYHAEGPCAMMWIPKLFGKRCIATIHGLDHQRAKWGKFASWYIMFGEKCAVRFADEIIVLSENIKNYFLENYGRKTVFIPNGVTRPQIKKADEIIEKFGIEKDEYILFLGRIVKEKGLEYLVDAFKKVKTDKKLVIAGGSSDTATFLSNLKNFAKEDERILFTGFVEGNVLEELYSNAYIYVLPSDLEGMPLSLLEAMSYGNCCLTSNIPECSFVLGNNGITFIKGNVDDLTKKIQNLCDNPQIVSDFKTCSADYICSKYNWDFVTNETLKLYGVEVSKSSEREKDESLTGK